MLFIAVLASGLAGCIASSGILPTGVPDTYAVTEMVAPLNGGGVAARRIALTEAALFCIEQGRVSVVDNIESGGDLGYPPTGATVTFHCMSPPTLR